MYRYAGQPTFGMPRKPRAAAGALQMGGSCRSFVLSVSDTAE
jgi:hypothetical protein